MSGTNIKVVCRFRPPNKTELAEGGTSIINVAEDGGSVQINGKEAPQSFSYDKVFDIDTRQQDVFEYSIKPTVSDILSGYNGTIFCYGQSGSGKTYTMMGSDIDDANAKGIIPRIVEQIFESIMVAPANLEFTVRVSYLEIYMEKVRDLLNPSADNLPIHEDKAKGVYVKGLMEVYVSSTEEMYQVMKSGGNNRVVGYTNMNAESSRSHSIVLITITQKNLDTGAAKSGKLYLVDLAGSEKVGKTGASGQTLEEAKKINKSLTALGMVINSLTDGKSSHVPYRDSKLTRILQESLGGNSRTTLIVNCSPNSYNEPETISTLRFGVRAKTIKNKAKMNAELSPAELKALLKRVKGESVTFQQYIQALESELAVWRSGGAVPDLQWASMDKASKGALPSPRTPTPSSYRPSLPDDSRPATPALALEKDEREEFMRREAELMEQIAEKEQELASRDKATTDLQQKLSTLKDAEKAMATTNQAITTELNDVKLQIQKASYDGKESAINVDSLREANAEIATELDQLKKTLSELRSNAADPKVPAVVNGSVSNGMDAPTTTEPAAVAAISEDDLLALEQESRQAMDQLNAGAFGTLTEDQVSQLQKQLGQYKVQLHQQDMLIEHLRTNKEELTATRTSLETRLNLLEVEYEELLEKAIADEEVAMDHHPDDLQDTIKALKTKLETDFASKKEQQLAEIGELRKQLQEHDVKYKELDTTMAQVKMAHDKLLGALEAQKKSRTAALGDKDKDVEKMRKSMAEQLAYFEVMKKGLMRDLQSRCEKVVELEISLEETREQYNQVLKASNNKAQQKKMAFLERNLEQLTNVQNWWNRIRRSRRKLPCLNASCPLAMREFRV
ncbi:kinesin heavy chain [Gongronella butleri]|nr:kinesin heavy chain [Gongronella butleri]